MLAPFGKPTILFPPRRRGYIRIDPRSALGKTTAQMPTLVACHFSRQGEIGIVFPELFPILSKNSRN